MILLRRDCLVFELAGGELMPCSAQEMAFSLVVDPPDHEQVLIIREAAAAVLHFFRVEQGRQAVTVAEFAEALGRALQDQGFSVEAPGTNLPSLPPSQAAACDSGKVTSLPSPEEVDLIRVEQNSGGLGELSFFQQLETDLSPRLASGSNLLIYRRLRECAMALCASKRWTARCQEVSDRIVTHLRLRVQGAQRSGACVLCIH
ncbi:MAG: hypothetical protein FJ405_07100 [Verrucomicrobia bacterium]|nr:hypothetical protein [Verrucomicrobiota bacterium]